MQTLYLDLHNGIHHGATLPILDNTITVVGKSDDSDVHLFDPDIATRHIALASSDQGLVLRALEGDCSVGNHRVSQGDTLVLNVGDCIRLDPSEVVVRIRNGEISQEVKEDNKHHNLTYGLLAAACLGLAFFLLRPTPESPPPVPAEHQVAKLLAQLDPAEPVKVDVTPQGVKVLGTLNDDLYRELATALASLEGVTNLTQPARVLLEQVQGVFRTNGYHANLAYENGGVVVVNNLDGNNASIQRVANYVKSDVTALTELRFAPFETSEPDAPFPAYPKDPNKRLTTIVDGDTAYVATTDGGRYFVGSILPNGQKIRRITKKGIQVDHNGQLAWLQL